KTTGYSKLIMSKRNKLIFNNTKDIEPDKYCIPNKKDFDDFVYEISAIVSPNKFFLIVFNEGRIININVDKLINKFIDKSDVEIYFVIPKRDKTNLVKCLPSENDNLKQYVLELDLGLICGK